MSPQNSSLQIGFVIFPDVTQLDFTGPWEVLSRLSGARCHLIARTKEAVRSNDGLVFQPTVTFDDCPRLDVIMVPGGHGHLQAMLDARLLEFLRQQGEECRYITAVCTGSLVLAAAGLLAGYRATTHWLSIHRLAQFGAIPLSQRVVLDRNRITGGGVTAGVDFALTLAALLADETTARSIQLQIEYAPAPPFNDGDPASAHPALVASIRDRSRPYTAKMAETDAKALGG